jgi:hypothetical protein
VKVYFFFSEKIKKETCINKILCVIYTRINPAVLCTKMREEIKKSNYRLLKLYLLMSL